MNKMISGGLLVLYISILIWLVLFKMSFSFSSLVAHHHQRSLNLVPFAAPSMVNGRINYGEMVFNCLFFIPFGLLLDVNFKKPGFFSRLALILAFSIAVELMQYIFAIGATDITDVITNTAGGVIGLILYRIGNKYMDAERLDRIIISAGILLALVFISVYASHFLRRTFGFVGAPDGLPPKRK